MRVSDFGESDTIGTGDIVTFPPNKHHSIDVCSDDCILINVLVRSSTFDRYFFSVFNSYDILTDFWTNALYGDHGNRGSSYLIFRCGADEKIHRCILDIFEQTETELPYQNQMPDALFHVLLISLLQDHEKHLESVYRSGVCSGVRRYKNYLGSKNEKNQ